MGRYSFVRSANLCHATSPPHHIKATCCRIAVRRSPCSVAWRSGCERLRRLRLPGLIVAGAASQQSVR
eukprot:12920154-Prorocentrum_lima.AAC.1